MRSTDGRRRQKAELSAVQNLEDKQISRLARVLKCEPNDALRSRLNQTALNYSASRVLWEQRPTYRKIKALLGKIHEQSDALSRNLLQFFDLTTYSFGVRLDLNRILERERFKVKREPITLADVTTGVTFLSFAIPEIMPKLQSDSSDVPFNRLISELATIYETATGCEAKAYIYEGRKTSLSPFLRFVRAFLRAVGDWRKGLTPEALRQRVKRTPGPDCIDCDKRIATEMILTGIPLPRSTTK